MDGAVQKTWYQAPYQDTINLKSGSLEIEAKAFLDNQQELKSSRIYIGVGGISWDTPDPTPTPTASSSANPS